MSDPVSKTIPKFDPAKAGRLPSLFLLAGVLGLVGTAAGFALVPERAAFSYLWAFVFVFTLCAGSLFWILLHHAVDADWSVVVRRFLETVAGLFPYLAVLFVPIVAFGPEIYHWMLIEPGDDVMMDHKAAFLDAGKMGDGVFYYGRAVFYFAFFILASTLYKKMSVAQDKDGNPHLSLKMRHMAYGMIPFFAASITFFAFDYLMALDPHWFSTMWGVYIFAGSAQSSMALLIIISNACRRAGYMDGVMSVEHNHIMGKLLFAFTVFWAYITFSQYFLIYYANIPEETWFFHHRNTGTWAWLSVVLVFGHFLLPFVLLITQPAKRDGRRLFWACGVVLFMHAVDLYWIIMPQRQVNEALHHASGSLAAAVAEKGYISTLGFEPHALDLLSLVGLVGILGYFFMKKLALHAIYPVRDPRLSESIHLKN